MLRGFTWLDTGTHDSLLEAAMFVKTIESHQGFKVACLEEIGFNNGWLNSCDLEEAVRKAADSKFSAYLRRLLTNASRASGDSASNQYPL